MPPHSTEKSIEISIGRKQKPWNNFCSRFMHLGTFFSVRGKTLTKLSLSKITIYSEAIGM